MNWKKFQQDKVNNRQKLNQLLQDEAQTKVTNILYADQWIPNITQEIDWDNPFEEVDEEEEAVYKQIMTQREQRNAGIEDN